MTLPVRVALVAVALALCAASPKPAKSPAPVPKGARLLYDVAFSAPEQAPDAEVKTVEPVSEKPFPTKFPTRVFTGHPTVAASLCGMEQPARLSVASGTNGLEGLEFVFDPRYRSYHVEFETCVAAIGAASVAGQVVQVGAYFDISQAFTLGFTAEGKIVYLDPSADEKVRDTPVTIGRYEVGKPMRVSVDLELPVKNQSWRISVDGKVLHEGPILANIPRGVRFVVRGNEKTVAALDDVRIWAQHYMGDEPEPKS